MEAKRIGSLMQIVRSGYSNYISYILVAWNTLNTTFLTFAVGLNINIPYQVLAVILLIGGVGLTLLVGLFHYRAGLYEGQINRDLQHNPYIRRLVPGKEPLYALTYKLLLQEPYERNPQEVQRAIRGLSKLTTGEDV